MCKMDRQRSFSYKSTKFLLFCLILCFSLLLLSSFSFWVMKATTVIPIENYQIHTRFHFAKPVLQSLPVTGTNYSARSINSSMLSTAVLSKTQNSSGFVNVTSKIEMGCCDFSKGRWVFDESYPLYTNTSCPFIDEGFNCQSNGRLDQGYMKWRWQPQGCDVSRFNATKMLEVIRGKRLVFVGDSINRNQWESMLCLLMGGVKDPKKVYEIHGRRITKGRGNYAFRFAEYECTVEFYVTHFLVHESKAKLGRKRVPTLSIDRIDRGTSRWRGADILVFNTGNWWSHSKTQAGVNYYQEGGQVHPHLEASAALRRALTTWGNWVDRHISSQKTQVFFRSLAPSHFRGGQWNTGGHCGEATRPLDRMSIGRQQKDLIALEVIEKMKSPVTFLDVAGLSAYRIDGHPSVYGSKFLKEPSSRIQDCSHWCLPGVPDAWNELLYHHLLSKQNKKTCIQADL